MRTWALWIVVLGLGCRGADECGGQGTAWLEVGRSDDEEFTAYSDGEAMVSTENADGEAGVALAMRTAGADTRDAVTVTVELEIDGYLRQLVGDTQLTCDNSGNGRVSVFAGLPQTVQADPDAFEGAEVYLHAVLIDGRDRTVEADPLLLELVTR